MLASEQSIVAGKKALNNLKLIGMSMLLVVGLGACDKPGPAETAGEKIDRTAEKAGQNIEEVLDEAGDAMSEQGAIAGMAIDDAEITTTIEAAILAEPGLKTLQISVDTKNGVVTLSGSVDPQSSSDRAKELAGAVSGVKDVDNSWHSSRTNKINLCVRRESSGITNES